eukprot:7490629-Alexandrium_andersonii.AAC.1
MQFKGLPNLGLHRQLGLGEIHPKCDPSWPVHVHSPRQRSRPSEYIPVPLPISSPHRCGPCRAVDVPEATVRDRGLDLRVAEVAERGPGA